ncbi:hypothetical protein CYMTET_31519 [Cymbomonas tetramitiformis]|uniref:Uncharacterized protein n=1 Tax=Cymbomonas tetramitiformis TaxID=36881 RepID=A0AAE0FH26_9CHLO|nr:hypothetical protein CYMTET_31519 [Cymbomonas tetramitiformis]
MMSEEAPIHVDMPFQPVHPLVDKQVTGDSNPFSKFVFQKTCVEENLTESQEIWEEFIEPLIGTGRGPLLNDHIGCTAPDKLSHHTVPRMRVLSGDFLLMQSGKTPNFDQIHPGRNLLFDLGASVWQQSSRFLSCLYHRRGIWFDASYAWEATVYDPKYVWQNVPIEFRPNFHYFNIPVSSEPEHVDNPLTLLKKVATPEDFVAFKLDIDANSIEMALMTQIMEDETLFSLIDELYFEYHFQGEWHALLGWGNTNETNMTHALKMFQTIRQKGIRMHFWP